MFHTLLKYHSNSEQWTQPHKRWHRKAWKRINFFAHQYLTWLFYTSANTEGWIIPVLTWTLYFFSTLQRKHWFYNCRNVTRTCSFQPTVATLIWFWTTSIKIGTAWGQHLYQVASRSIHPFHHNTSLWPTNQSHQLDRLVQTISCILSHTVSNFLSQNHTTSKSTNGVRHIKRCLTPIAWCCHVENVTVW